MYSTETGAAKPIAEPVKQENSMPTPPPTTNGHIGPQDAATAIVSPTSQSVSHITEETSGVEIAAVETVQTQPNDQQPVESTSESMKEEPETQRPSALEAFAEITPTAATPSTLPQAQSPTATKKQVYIWWIPGCKLRLVNGELTRFLVFLGISNCITSRFFFVPSSPSSHQHDQRSA